MSDLQKAINKHVNKPAEEQIKTQSDSPAQEPQTPKVGFVKTRIATFVIGYLGKKLDGHKTNLGGAGFIMLGLSGILFNMFEFENAPKISVGECIGYIAFGCTVLGLGGKAEKLKNEIKCAKDSTN